MNAEKYYKHVEHRPIKPLEKKLPIFDYYDMIDFAESYGWYKNRGLSMSRLYVKLLLVVVAILLIIIGNLYFDQWQYM